MTEPDDLVLRFDPEARALFHLELLGCFEPADALPGGLLCDDDGADFDGGWDEDDDGRNCTHCGGSGSREVDDIWWDDCDQYGWGPCTSCRGTGERRHQWVF